nr:MAG TPA: hypothetical protein [Caudoviricetes sp.]
MNYYSGIKRENPPCYIGQLEPKADLKIQSGATHRS